MLLVGGFFPLFTICLLWIHLKSLASPAKMFSATQFFSLLIILLIFFCSTPTPPPPYQIVYIFPKSFWELLILLFSPFSCSLFQKLLSCTLPWYDLAGVNVDHNLHHCFWQIAPWRNNLWYWEYFPLTQTSLICISKWTDSSDYEEVWYKRIVLYLWREVLHPMTSPSSTRSF